ncbi:unnamed protein product [Closterium sp. Naga37s-1]|nr:unnamed protein product [Closterium sp. Naga37s-1]
MASGHGRSVGLGAGSTRGGAPGSPPRPMEGRVGDGPGGAGACFIGGFLSVAAPTSRQSFRYDGPRPPPSGQTLPESVSEEEDEDEAGEGEEGEENEGSGDDSEEGWDPEKHGGGEGRDDDEDHEMDDLEPEEVQEAVGEEVGEGGGVGAATEAGSQHVAEGGGSVGVKVGRKPASLAGPRVRKKANKVRERAYPATFTGEPLGDGVIAPEFLDEDGGSESSKGTGKGTKKPGWQVIMFGPKGADEKRPCKICTDRISWKQSTTTPGERHFASFHTAHMHVWFHRYHTPSIQLPGETFPRGGYKGVPDGYVERWPHAKTWPHLAKQKGKAFGGGQGSGGIERFMTTKLTSVELRQAIAKLVVTCDLPFRIVEAEAFRELLILLNHNCAQKNFIPSRWTVSRDTVVYAAAALQSAIAEMLAKEGELGCRVSFTIDMWTAPNNRAWLVVTGHWVDENFQLRTMVFEFREIHGRHTGKQMARVVEETVVHWGLEGRCLGFTSDNASSNVAAFRWMSEEGGGQCFFNSRMHFRCLAHVINLAVKAALAVAAIRKLLRILREMASWIGFSPQRSGKFLGLQRTLNAQANPAKPKPALKLVQDSPTRWGSTHDMVERAGVLQEPITVFFAQTKGLSKADKAKVDSLRLTDADWETLHAVKTFLSPFAKVSKAAEGPAYPTVAMVLPYYNGLIDAMESRLAKGPSATLKPMIEAALGLLKKYELMSSNELWIATFLDPSMKAAWFDDPHWETLHPETDRRARPRPSSGEVIQLVRDRVTEYQARAAALAPRPTPLATVTEEEGDAADDDEDAQFLPSRRRLAARLSASQEAGRGGMVQDDEVSRYLSERVRCDVSALEYWRTATNMQTLRRMARDYLAIPATSASSERVFSLGRNLISWKRHRLASQRTRAVMILKSWYSSHPGQRIGEGRRAKGVAPPEFAIEGEGEEEDDEEEEEGEEEWEEEHEGVGAGDTAGGEQAVVASKRKAQGQDCIRLPSDPCGLLGAGLEPHHPPWLYSDCPPDPLPSPLPSSFRDKGTGARLADSDLPLILFGLLGAGVGTTSSTLAFAVHMLTQHPDVSRKLQAEIDRSLFKGLEVLKYLDMVVKETLRLYPAAPIAARLPVHATTLAGYHIPANTPVVVPIFAAHRCPDFFPRPLSFLPERFGQRAAGEKGVGWKEGGREEEAEGQVGEGWGEEGAESIKSEERGEGKEHEEVLWTAESEAMYLPFGAGPRMCIGARFAMMEIKLCLALLLRVFDITSVSDTPYASRRLNASETDAEERGRKRGGSEDAEEGSKWGSASSKTRVDSSKLPLESGLNLWPKDGRGEEGIRQSASSKTREDSSKLPLTLALRGTAGCSAVLPPAFAGQEVLVGGRTAHLMVVWLVRSVGGFHLPLPAPAPVGWADGSAV